MQLEIVQRIFCPFFCFSFYTDFLSVVQSIVRSLIDRASALCSTLKNRQDEIKHVKETLKLNLYPNTTLIKKLSNRTEQQFNGFAIILYYPELS